MPTILIADDAGLFVALETSPVLRAGCQIVPVRSARDLLARASTLSPDLFLLDAELLGNQTRSCLRSLKADRKLSGVPIVIAARDPSSIQIELSEQDVAFAKPVQPEAVGAALKNLLPLARRSSRRVPLSVAVVCRLRGRTLRLRTKDLGAGGLFLKTPDDLPRGTRFTADFSLPDPDERGRGQRPISATCEVVRRVDPEEHDLIAGVGARFVRMDDFDAGFLERFITAEAA
jgi:uncharacterized protein (TIGR02266 family)